MFMILVLPILGILLTLPSKLNAAESSGCTFVAKNTSIPVQKCLKLGYIRVAGRRVPLGVYEMRIQLEEPRREAVLYCGRYSGTYSWKFAKKDANQIRVSFLHGYLHVTVYWCDSFSGPKESGIRCVVEAFSTSCPGLISHNHTCVYEVQKKRFSSDTVRNAVEVKGEVAALVKKAYVSTGVSHTEEQTVVNTYSVNSRSYIVIPAGYRFCSFSEVISVKDPLAATGFKWECKVPTYVQTSSITGRCTNLSLCETQSPCQTSRPLFSSGDISAVAHPVGIMLLALCIIVV
ncbi:Hypothetical predicted protein [Paramuricea clavata]|uniref:Uncharacterized protein n=1 Tax=Paramuricea clavata TaxID=317549 RepID=A0A7D9E7V5_PARCT|nr:Hypothetical predicted protein [Paramuricea clavata]